MIQKILSFLLFFIFFDGFSQGLQLSENTKVSIITIGTASPSYALYGHTGIRFKDNSTNLDAVFNYGAFDFQTPNFMLRFVKGDLQYFVTSNSYQEFEYSYRYENRSIYEQELNLSSDKIKLLYTTIYNSTLTDERFYTYKFIDKNCTVIIIDKINEVLGNKVIDFQQRQEKTYRTVLFPYANEHFLQQLGINIIFGTKVDEKATKLFLPLDLMQELKTVKHNGKALVKETKTVFEAQQEPLPFNFFDSIYILIAALGLIVFINNRKLTFVYFAILGFLGLFFSLVGLYSLHQEVLWNYNVLLFNPLYLILVFFMVKQYKPKILLISAIILTCNLVYLLYMLNKIHLISVAPFWVANCLLLLWLIRISIKEKA
jgi:hypothetical protein